MEATKRGQGPGVLLLSMLCASFDFLTAPLSSSVSVCSFLLVLFPFVTPVLQKMKVTLLPSDVMEFFKNVFTKMKKERGKGSSTVSPTWWPLLFRKSPECRRNLVASSEAVVSPALQIQEKPELCPAWASKGRRYLCSWRVCIPDLIMY